jgi:tetrahydromethanopterin S-methyltransferase subunit B
MNDQACVIDHGTDKDGYPRRAEAFRGLLCKNHSTRLAQWLQDVAVDYTLLSTRLAPMKSATDYSSDGRGSGNESAAPLNLGIVALRDAERGGAPRARGDELWYELPDIPSVLATLHSRAEDLRSALDPAHEHDDSLRGRTVTGEINYLIAAYDSLCHVDWIDEAFLEIKALWIALQRAHNRPQPRPIGDCLTLDCAGKVWPRPETQPWCSTCRRIYDTNADLIKVRLESEKRKTA